jgi:drug/metabolite transporter (DMT)-like permease
MPPVALGLLLIAAVLHASWNLLIKRAGSRLVFTYWALMVSVLGLLPVLVLSGLPPVRVWLFALASGMGEAVYFFLLTRAYDIEDFSLVYPLARGAAPVFLLFWAAIFLGERPSGAGLAGIALLIAGLLLVGGGVWRGRASKAGFSRSGTLTALAVALAISIYTVIDGAAARFAPPIPYAALIFGTAAIFITPLVLVRFGARAALAEARANWPRILLVGVLTLTTYVLVLRAYALSRVNYAGAIREVSIVFAAIIGWRWLGERFGAVRTAGAIVIVAGILVIAVAG